MNETTLHDRRLARVNAEMEREGLDALLLAKNETSRYVSGYQRYFVASFLPFVHLAVVIRAKGTVLMLPDHIVPYGRRCPVLETVPLPLRAEDHPGAVRRLLDRYGVGSGRVGVELDFVPGAFVQGLREALPDLELTDATPSMERVAMVKFPEEVELLRESARIVDMAVGAIFAKARAGVTEQQLAAEGAAVALEAGAECVHHLCVRSGENAYELSPLNTDRVIREGDPIQLDIGFVRNGYVSDINRTLVIGPCSESAVEVIRAVVGIQREVLAAIRPGVTASSLFEVTRKGMEAAGLAEQFTMPFIGHSIGISLHENPYMAAGVETELMPGMVLAVEPGVYAPSRGTCRMEDMVVVTDAGHECLTHSPDDLELNGIRT